MPPLALPAEPYMVRAREIWENLQLPPLSPQPPWHGYSLGDWSEVWSNFANKAVGRRLALQWRKHLLAPQRRYETGNTGARY